MDHNRKEYSKIIQSMMTGQSSYIGHWKELNEYMRPRREKFNTAQQEKGEKRNQKIIDPAALYSSRVLQSGMHAGMTSPSRPWIRLTVSDPGLAEFGPVKAWLSTVQTRMLDVFARSNLYTALPLVYGDLGVYATAAMAILEDAKDVMRAYTFPIGSYAVAVNDRGIVDMFSRQYQCKAKVAVERWGSRCSERVLRAYREARYDEPVNVAHLIMPNPKRDTGKLDSSLSMPYRSVYFEPGDDDGQMLQAKGFEEFPIMVPRWESQDEEAYGGGSPGMDCLGMTKALQLLHRKKAEALNKLVKPPLQGPTSLKGKSTDDDPGGITYLDVRDSKEGLRPLYQVAPQIDHIRQDIADHRQQISRAFYEDLFLMLAMSDRRQITAREIDERHEEKLIVLGPTLEKMNDELHDPLIDRAFGIMLRRGMIPAPPRELQQGEPIKVEYVSVMAQAQKLIATGSIDRFLRVASGVVSVSPESIDKIDFDQTLDVYSDILSLPPKIVRTDEQVAEIRLKREEAQQAANQAALAQQAAQTAKTLSDTSTQQPSALKEVMQMAGVG